MSKAAVTASGKLRWQRRIVGNALQWQSKNGYAITTERLPIIGLRFAVHHNGSRCGSASDVSGAKSIAQDHYDHRQPS